MAALRTGGRAVIAAVIAVCFVPLAIWGVLSVIDSLLEKAGF